MMHKPIQLQNVTLSFPHKTCFEDFSANIIYGSRIAIIGRNGSGKSTLLKMLQGLVLPTQGEVKISNNVRFGYVPQVVEEFNFLSGGQRFNEALTQALILDPNVLLLDEPTNHLDAGNRKSLLRMLRSYSGTLIMASHDVELLNNTVDSLWHIDNSRIHMFSGSYDNYKTEIAIQRASIEREFSRLAHARKMTHQALMQEQERAKKSRLRGEKHIEQRKWPTIVSNEKARRAIETAGRKTNEIKNKKQELTNKLSGLNLPEIIKPSFSLNVVDVKGRTLVSISEGSINYKNSDKLILDKISLSLMSGDRIAIKGTNGSGKSTLMKAIMGDVSVKKSGHWHTPKLEDIGYLDQHYATLEYHKTVLETIHTLVPAWSHIDVRRHLNGFLFRNNEEVNALVSTLSGGEKARLSLAQIAVKTPVLLMLDEVTNNLDLEAREHVIQVLKEYPGAMIVISHDEDFLNAIYVSRYVDLADLRKP